MPVAAVLLGLVLALAGCGDGDGESKHGAAAAAPPAADAPIPRAPAALAERLTDTHRALDQAVDDWRGHGDPAQGAPPEDVTLYALDQQRIHILLSARQRLAHDVLARLPGRVAAHVRASLRARRMLGRLSTPQPLSRFKTGPPRPAGQLLRFYREAQRRFGVSWQVLAAVNLVESAFGRMRNHSTAGAQGPMQFIPATWEAYGEGDIADNRDAILAAGRYLADRGGPEDMDQALFAYNPSDDYVAAIQAYAGVLLADERAYRGYYGWQVYYGTESGVFLLPEGYPQRPAREIEG
jgi:membrane-bound lytic murein transglycosylase B